VILEDRKLVREAMKLFESDVLRKPYPPGAPALLISPLNARAELAKFLEGARRELLIYDPNVSDSAMLRILTEKSKAGAEIKILGGAAKLPAHKLAQIRLHARVILRDGTDIFIGSQSLRTLELDGRREVGVIFRDRGGRTESPRLSNKTGSWRRSRKRARRITSRSRRRRSPRKLPRR
jgi:phosphatidylserine/phosphatidylglycerophosphate/cardiolipin synthase-like enzyme